MIIPLWAAPILAVAASTVGVIVLIIWRKRIKNERKRELAAGGSDPVLELPIGSRWSLPANDILEHEMSRGASQIPSAR